MKQQLEKWEAACDVADFDDEEMLECRAGERQVLLVRLGDRIVACPAMCPHLEERLAFGFTDGNVLTCSKHLWQWDLNTGTHLALQKNVSPWQQCASREGRSWWILRRSPVAMTNRWPTWLFGLMEPAPLLLEVALECSRSKAVTAGG